MNWLAIVFPQLPLQAVHMTEQIPRSSALALVDDARKPRVLECNAAATAAGIRPGQGLQAALALHAGLQFRTLDEQTSHQHLLALADWAWRFSSMVSMAKDALLVEVGASLNLFGGWPALQQRMCSELQAWGWQFRMAAAPTAPGALVLARSHSHVFLTSQKQLQNALASMPLARGGLDNDSVVALQAMGLRTLGELFRLPRAQLAQRIGPAALIHLDRLRGLQTHALPMHRPAQRYERRIDFDDPLHSQQALLFPMRRMVADFAQFLTARQGGVQHFRWHFVHANQASTSIDMHLLSPRQDAAGLLEFSRTRLEHMSLAAPVEALVLIAQDLPVLQPAHEDLFQQDASGSDWTTLLERLRMRLGDNALSKLQLHADHRPDQAWKSRPWSERTVRTNQVGRSDKGEQPPAHPRPGWLLPQAIPMRPPPQYILAGPERIESGWWDHVDQRRDYYIVQTYQGQKAWAYVPAGTDDGWMLHGWFA